MAQQNEIELSPKASTICGDNEYPMFGYIYNNLGKYGNKHIISNAEELEQFFNKDIIPALSEKREVRITDTLDFMIFHAKGGKVIWPPPNFDTNETYHISKPLS